MINDAVALAAGLALLAVQGVALWLVVEGVHWLYCKATGRTY